MPAGLRRRLLFAFFNRRMPHFSKPKTFNDKVNWRILNDRRPLLEWTCDKLLMKEHAAEAALDGFHIPNTIWSGVDVCELQNVEVPDYWVLKPNHRSGLIYFGHGCPDPGELSDVTAGWLDASEWEHKGERRMPRLGLCSWLRNFWGRRDVRHPTTSSLSSMAGPWPCRSTLTGTMRIDAAYIDVIGHPLM
jgi:hypothetical protein